MPQLSLFRRRRLLQSGPTDGPALAERLAARARRDQLIIAAGAIAVGLILLGFLGYALRLSYAHAWDGAQARTASLARVLDEESRRTLQVVDLSLMNLAGYLQRHPEIPPYDAAFARLMASQLRTMPYVRALFVIGPDGFITQDTDQGTPHVSLADRDYFQHAAAHPTDGLFVGQPLKSRSTQIGSPWFLSLSRPLAMGDGAFHGLIVAAVEPRYFERFYDELRPDRDTSIALAHRDGLIVARFPLHENAAGHRVAEPLRRLVTEEPASSFTGASPVDGVVRLFSYRLVASSPLVVVVGIGRNAIVDGWWRDRRVELGAALLALVALAATAVTLGRDRARDAMRDAHLYRLEKDELIARMTGSIAHDFNNVLSVAHGNLELVARHLSDRDGCREYVARALAAIQRGVALVSQLLTYSREAPGRKMTVSLSALIAEMDWMIQHASNPAKVVFRCDDPVWGCALNSGEFERALMNLCCNARDAMPKGGTITIETFNVPAAELRAGGWSDLPTGDYVACRVRDEGEGMPPHVVAQACNPYFTTKPAGRGTGLGLSQVAECVRQCGGRLYIESTVGVGTTVTTLFPRVQHETGDAPESASPPGANDQSGRKSA